MGEGRRPLGVGGKPGAAANARRVGVGEGRRPLGVGPPRRRRFELLGQRGATVWLTGLPAAGKSTIARALEERLVTGGRLAYVLDGDELRRGLTSDLGFDADARAENVRRGAEAARLLADAGVIAVVALISPYAVARARAAALHAAAGLDFLEVFVDTPLDECERRDPKGFYARARRGLLRGFTGVDDPYEPPADPALRLHTLTTPPDECAALIAALLAQRGVIRLDRGPARGS